MLLRFFHIVTLLTFGWGSLLLSGCSLDPSGSDRVRLAFQFEKASESDVLDLSRAAPSRFAEVLQPPETVFSATSAPTSITDLSCMVVNVLGADIPSSDDGTFVSQSGFDDILSGDHCVYPGITSALITNGSSVNIELEVPRGANRVIQVIGVTSTIGCPDDEPFSSKVGGHHDDQTDFPYLLEVGRVVTDTFTDQSVTIANTFDSSNLKEVRCNSSSSSSSSGSDGIPGTISDLFAWYRSDEEVINGSSASASDQELVYYWNDRSGNSRNAEGGASTFKPKYIASLVNSEPGLKWEHGSSAEMKIPSSLYSNSASDEATVFFVIQYASGVGSTVKPLLSNRSATDGQGTMIGITAATDNSISVISNGTSQTAPGSISVGSSHILTVTRDSANTYEVYVDGTLQSFASGSNSTYSPATGSDTYIGYDEFSGDHLDRDNALMQVIIYERKLSSSEISDVECWLSDQYAITVGHGC